MRVSNEELDKLLKRYDNSDKKLYMYGRKVFGFIFNNAKIDVDNDQVKITQVLSINGIDIKHYTKDV